MTKMASTGKAKKSKAKKNELLPKPKRPMSAYNFFFRAERAKIMAGASSEGSDDNSNNGTSFEEIGRTIGKRWRNIKDDELAKYKELADMDTVRYQDKMKAFYNDELKLMCLGKKPNDVQPNHHDGAPKKSVDSVVGGQLSNHGSWNLSTFPKKITASGNFDQKSAEAAQSNGSRPVMDLMQQQQILTNHGDYRHGQMKAMMLANERSSAAGMVNPVHNTYPQSIPLTSISSMEPKDMSDDQILQLLFLHQESSSSSSPRSEAVMKLILNQKATIQQRQQKLTEELNELLLKNALLDRMIAKEASIRAGKNDERNEVNLSAPSPSGGLVDIERPPTEQLFQFPQKQETVTNERGAALESHMPTDDQPFRAMFGPPAHPPAPSMQELLYRNNQQSFSHFMSNHSGMDVPRNNANMANPRGNSMSVEEMLFMKNFMDGGE